MLLLGIDLGTSSVKVSVVNAETQECIMSAHYPESELEIISPLTGWAEPWRARAAPADSPVPSMRPCRRPGDARGSLPACEV